MDFRVKRLLSFDVGDERVTTVDYSVYVYTNDASNRRATIVKSGSAYTSPVTETYTYDTRDQLISGQGLSYVYDDIGNRITAEGKTYIANNLNQYTKIDDFVPQYDADGNQTLIKTETGVWSVTYNAENRPIRWQSGDTVITMAFDRMGRRIEMRTVKDGEETLQRFVYDNYLCIQQLRGADNALFHSYVWDPTEPIATRPLVFLPAASSLSYYFHDGNKNVSDLVDAHGSVVHYAYTPFGTSITSAPSENPYRFSSEMCDDELRLSYYNYRHYNALYGSWVTRDLMGEVESFRLYTFLDNNPFGIDILGLARMLTGALIGSGSSWGSGKEVALEVWDLIDELKKKKDSNGRTCFEIEIRDLARLGSEDVYREAQRNADNVFVIAHGGITVNDNLFTERDFVWEDHKKEKIVEGFDIWHDGTVTDVKDFGCVKDENLFGCYMSPHVRKKTSGSWISRRHTSSKDTYAKTYREFYNTLKAKYANRSDCPCPIKIVIYEGEERRKDSSWSTDRVRMKYPERF